MNKRYMDKTLSPERRAEELLSELSVEEKIAQVVCYLPQKDDFDGIRKASKHGIGQISCLEMRRIDSLKEAVKFQQKAQRIVMEQSKHSIPAIFHMEGLSGAYIQGATSFPTGIGRASSWDPELEEEIAGVVGRQQRAVGITQTLAPVLDVSRDPRMGRQGETYGEDPTLASAMGVAYTRGIQNGKTGQRKGEAVAKHFLGSHQTQGGIHGTDAEISERTLKEVYGKPFQAAITEAQLRGVMPSYNSINGEPVSGSKEILKTLLREEMKFDGIVVADYSAIFNVHHVQKVCDSPTDAGLRTMSAGMDIEFPNQHCFNEELGEWFSSGKEDIEILNKAVKRVLTVKFRMGLFENPFALEGVELEDEFYKKEDEEITLRSARESLILLKNEEVLPISKDTKKIAVIGCHVNNARHFFGGYTHMSMSEAVVAALSSMAGVTDINPDKKANMVKIPGTQIQNDETPEFDLILKLQKPHIKNLLEELEERFSDSEISYAYGYSIAGNDDLGFAEALKVASNADLVILTLGGKYSTGSIATTGEGVDSTNINLPKIQEDFIKKVSGLHKPLVGIHFDGRPISSDVADEYLGAILEAWNPAEKGAEAIVDVLTGNYNPSGKLPVSIAYNAGQVPIYYNHFNGSAWHQSESVGFPEYVDTPHTPRYHFGHGLSYTNFAYSNLTIDKKELSPDDLVHIDLDIENTGDEKGTEIVQLYVKDCYASMTRPVMDLAGFFRIELVPGEKKTIRFELDPSQLAFIDADRKWKIEAGKIEVLLGSSSDDIRLEDSFEIVEDKYVISSTRTFYANANIVV